MGGLKKHMPITRWTPTSPASAIAGFPIANGFYSKDEILWKAFTSRHSSSSGRAHAVARAAHLGGRHRRGDRHRVLHVPLVLHDVHGEYRGGAGHRRAQRGPALRGRRAGPPPHARGPRRSGAAHAHGHSHAPRTAHAHAVARPRPRAHAAAAHDDHDAHGGHHGGTPHESPWTITLVLSLLAVGSFVTLFLGIPRPGPTPPRCSSTGSSRRCSPRRPSRTSHVWEYVFQGVGVLAATVGWVAAARSTRTGGARSRRGSRRASSRLDGRLQQVLRGRAVRPRRRGLVPPSPGRSAGSTAASSTAW